MTPKHQAASVILAVGVVMPGLMIAGVFGDFTVPPVAWLIVSTLAGAACTVLFTGRRPVLSAALGAIFGFGSVFAIPFYLVLRRPLGPTFFFFELVLPFGLVGLPLYAVWQAVDGSTARQRDR